MNDAKKFDAKWERRRTETQNMEKALPSIGRKLRDGGPVTLDGDEADALRILFERLSRNEHGTNCDCGLCDFVEIVAATIELRPYLWRNHKGGGGLSKVRPFRNPTIWSSFEEKSNA